jgi:soluble lytic murein transglycosylase-like protein
MGKKKEIVRFGTLNPLKEDVLQESFDPATTDVLRELSVQAGKRYGSDAFEQVKHFKGVVLEVREINDDSFDIGSFFSQILGSESTYYQPKYAYRVYVPELFSFGELPDIIAESNGEEIEIPPEVRNDIALYPFFYPAEEKFDESVANVGDIVYIDFANRINLNVDSDERNNLYLGRVVNKSIFAELSDDISATLTNAKEAFTDCVGKIKENIVPTAPVAAALPKRVSTNNVEDLKPSLTNRITRWDDLIRDSIQRLNLNPEIFPYVQGFISVESGGDPNAVSSGNAIGLMQFTRIAAKDYAEQFGVTPDFPWQSKNFKNENDPRFNPQLNIDAGASFVDSLYKRHNGNPYLMYTAYNVGWVWAKNRFIPYLEQRYPNTPQSDLSLEQVSLAIADAKEDTAFLNGKLSRTLQGKNPKHYTGIFRTLDSWLARGNV